MIGNKTWNAVYLFYGSRRSFFSEYCTLCWSCDCGRDCWAYQINSSQQPYFSSLFLVDKRSIFLSTAYLPSSKIISRWQLIFFTNVICYFDFCNFKQNIELWSISHYYFKLSLLFRFWLSGYLDITTWSQNFSSLVIRMCLEIL